ncbi:hypothetical protein MHYP_G00065040 [Metynnis hypsauchen]
MLLSNHEALHSVIQRPDRPAISYNKPIISMISGPARTLSEDSLRKQDLRCNGTSVKAEGLACALLGGGYSVMASRWELMGRTWACYSASVGSKPDSAKYTHHKLFPLRSAPWAGRCYSQASVLLRLGRLGGRWLL